MENEINTKKEQENIDFHSIEDVKEYSDKLMEKFLNTMDAYEKQATVPSYTTRLDYTVAAIYLSLKKVMPEGVSFRIDYRTKSRRSMKKSTDLEIMDSDLNKLKKDIFGIKIIITDIDGKLDLDSTNPQYQKLINLQDKKIDNTTFIVETREWLSDSADTMQNEENYYEKTISLLNRLQESTYVKCDKETEIPYSTQLANVKEAYITKQKNDTLSLSLSKDQAAKIELLLNDLEKRLDDKLERELLNIFLPKALDSNLLSNMLQIGYIYDKETVKPTGYVADFYNLNVGDAFAVEVQTQSYLRYLDGKKGASFHNGKVGKGIKISSFFELVDKNDANSLEYYLKILGQMPVDTYENGIIEDTKSGIIKKVEEAYSHVKIKDKIKFSNKKSAKQYNMDNYLFELSEYVSANMSICRSAHNFSTPSVNIENASLTEAFSDVLRKRDGISCLAQMLVDRLDSILQDKNDSRTNKSYKQINIRDIANYSKTLPRVNEKQVIEK